MRKIILMICICGVLFSCKKESEKRLEEMMESSQGYKRGAEIEKMAEPVKEKTVKDVYTDTTGMSKSPVKVYKYKLVQKEYSNLKDIKIYFKNISKKNISAIRFEWYGENAFNEPAEMGSYTSLGAGDGFTDVVLKAGASKNGIFPINSKDGKKIISARAYEVMFEDGSKWTLRKE